MPSSLTPNAVISTLGESSTILHSLKLSASLEESCTLMTEFISTVSSISTDNSALEQLQYSMWEASTLTSSSLEGLRRRDSITRSKMAMWSQEDSNAPNTRAEVALGQLILNGVRLSRQRLLESFGSFATNWFRNMWLEVTLLWPNMSNGGIDPSILRTRLPTEYGSTRLELQQSTSGSCRLSWDLEQSEIGE